MPGRPRFCSRDCKSEFQRRAKPVTRDWLYQKYVIEGLDCTQIARIVSRDSKSVWNWLKGFGIPTRPRGSDKRQHFKKGEPNAFQGRRHTAETRRRLSEIAKADGRVPFDPKIGPPYRGKKGAGTSNWKGGITPERQAFYATEEWRAVACEVYSRDKNTCQRCLRKRKSREKFHIHHIVSFECKELRAVASNLILLCRDCHLWVHSKKNADKRYILPCPTSSSKLSPSSTPPTAATPAKS
jgi:hypothetical protein